MKSLASEVGGPTGSMILVLRKWVTFLWFPRDLKETDPVGKVLLPPEARRVQDSGGANMLPPGDLRGAFYTVAS